MVKSLLLCLSVVCALALVFAPGGTALAEEKSFGDAITIGTIGEPSNLIPYLSSDSASSEVQNRLFIGLLKYDKNINITTEAAEYYEVLDGGLKLRFKLREGLRWSDGREITTDDIEFTYNMMIDPATPTAYAGDFLKVETFRKLDKYRFEVTYKEPFARSLVTWMGNILPKHSLEGEDLSQTALKRNPVSSGAFLLKKWEPGSRLTLVANPDYFEGRPNLDGIIFRVIPDLSTMFMELKAGKIDYMGLTPIQYVYEYLSGKKNRGVALADNFQVYRDMSLSYTYLAYNLSSPLFSDVRARKAIAHAVNKRDIVSGALFDQGVPTTGPYRPNTWVYNNDIEDYAYDPEKARALLAECGWTPGSDGILRKNGIPFVFTILVNQGNDQRAKTAVIIQSQLKDVGIQVKIRAVEWAAFLKQFVYPGHFDAIILAWTITQDPDLYDVWHSSRAFEGGLNFMRYKNEEVDRLLEQARSTFDQELRKKLYFRVQEILHDEQPYCFLYVPYALPAVHKRFRGIEKAPAGITYNFNEWWVPNNEQLYRSFLTP